MLAGGLLVVSCVWEVGAGFEQRGLICTIVI